MATRRYRPARWERGKETPVEEGRFVENEKIDAFLAEIDTVCEKHGFDIDHEDSHGAFEIVNRGFGSGALDKARDCTVLK